MDTIDIDQRGDGGVSFKYIQDVTNTLSARLRAYRQEHIPRVYFDSKFDRVVQFLKRNSGDDLIEITDDQILPPSLQVRV